MRSLILGLSLLSVSCPNPKPEPTPTPPPPPTECVCRPPGSEDPGWKGATEPPVGERQWAADVFQDGRIAIGDVCGQDQGESIDKMVKYFQEHQVCAGRWPKEVISARPDGLWEEWHVVTTGAGVEGCWATVPGAYKGVWQHPDAYACPKGFCEHGCEFSNVGGK